MNALQEFVPKNHKFGGVSLSLDGVDWKKGFSCRTWPTASGEIIRLEEDLIVLQEQHVALDGLWSHVLTERVRSQFSKANFVAVRTKQSENPRCSDDESRSLMDSLNGIVFGLRLQGIYMENSGVFFHGANLGEPELNVFSIKAGHNMFGPWRNNFDSTVPAIHPVPMSIAVLSRASQISEALHSISGDEKRGFRRLWRGIHAFNDGISKWDVRERLHQFVRVIEALVYQEKPKSKGGVNATIGAEDLVRLTKSMFSPSLSPYQGVEHGSPREMELLKHLYNVRSKVEHIDDLDLAISSFDEEGDGHEIIELAMRAELMASSALSRVLLTTELLETHRTKDSLRKFYEGLELDQRAAWGEPFDVEAEIRSRRVKELSF